MGRTVHVRARDGSEVAYVDELRGQGGMKDVYFSPDGTYVVAFFRDLRKGTAEYQAVLDRVGRIVEVYRKGIFDQEGGAYWRNLFCWPEKVVEVDGKLGIVAPVYQKHFFFTHGSKNGDMLGIKGREKEGKWFASASNRNRFLDPREKGGLAQYLRICIHIARAVRRMHAAGLAHSDLSYKNVLIDPVSGSACVIDIDGLVVPGLFPPDVVGTPDFIAPEVLATQHLGKGDKGRILPSRRTDQHALAVLIYMYLLYRHPLRGGKVHATDPVQDELLGMGANALFVEHGADKSNRPNLRDVRASDLPWADVGKLPYTLLGPYLSGLFERAFVEGLHTPELRPTASEWEVGLVKTVDLLQPCQNKGCEQGWFVFDNRLAPRCPYCGTGYQGLLPVLDFYSSKKAGSFSADNHRLMVYHGQNLYRWHVNGNVFPNERLGAGDKVPVGDFQLLDGKWYLVNRRLEGMRDVTEGKVVGVNSMVELSDGKQVLLSGEEGGRLCRVSLVGGS